METGLKKSLSTLVVLLLAAVAAAEPRMDGSNVSVPRNLVAGGGGRAASAGMIVDGAVGESGVTALSGGSYKLGSGLAPMRSQPGSITSLVAVSKTTGTLDLVWTAPGRDGFVGALAAGYYRIDYSSDPAHVFDPTVFVTQFSMSVAPGDPQQYEFTGLLANTTYYARIYLADERLAVAETSAQAAESTLARLPPAPAISGVYSTSVTISWSLPAGGAEGYAVNASSTDFGQLYPGGVVTTTQTANGLLVTLTVSGLTPQTTYFFSVGSLNWQGQGNFTTVLTTVTVGLPTISNLASTLDPVGRRITLSWSNPSFPAFAGATVLVSSLPIVTQPSDGTAYPVGTRMADGSIVQSSAAVSGILQSNLLLDVTTYFSIFTRTVSNSYSVGVSTYLMLDLPPMAVAGLQGAASSDGTSMTIRWAQPIAKYDGTPMRNPASNAFELNRFEIQRSTALFGAPWTVVSALALSATSYTTPLPIPGGLYYYKVVSLDAVPGSGADQTMIVDTLGNVYALAADQISRVRLSPAAATYLTAPGNPTGGPLLVRASSRPQDVGGRVLDSVAFQYMSPVAQVAPAPTGGPALSYDLHYDVAGGLVVPNALDANPASSINTGDAATSLSAYYVSSNGSAMQVFGQVNPAAQTLHVDSSLMGTYQIHSVVRNQAFNFDISGISNKMITPNGDGINDTVVFVFDNPRDSAVSGRIYDMMGAFVADMKAGPNAGASLMWDGKAGGAVVPRGVYVYQIKAEGKTFSGTVVVIR